MDEGFFHLCFLRDLREFKRQKQVIFVNHPEPELGAVAQRSARGICSAAINRKVKRARIWTGERGASCVVGYGDRW